MKMGTAVVVDAESQQDHDHQSFLHSGDTGHVQLGADKPAASPSKIAFKSASTSLHARVLPTEAEINRGSKPGTPWKTLDKR